MIDDSPTDADENGKDASEQKSINSFSTNYFELSDRTAWLLLCITTLLGLFIRVVMALKPGGLIHPDEIYQSLEIAHKMVFGYGNIPWEFQLGGWDGYGPARSYLFPLIYALLFSLCQLFGLSYPNETLLVVRLFDACISTLLIPVIYLFVREITKRNLLALLSAILISIWYEIIFFGIRSATNSFVLPFLYLSFYLIFYSMENEWETFDTQFSITIVTSTALFGISFLVLLLFDSWLYLILLSLAGTIILIVLFINSNKDKVTFVALSICAGILFGFCFYVRPDVILVVIPAILLRARFRHWLQACLFGIGFILMSFVQGFFDLYYYGEFYISTWNWYRFNILDGMSTVFGTEPPGFYSRYLFGTHGILLLLVIIALFFYLIDFRRFFDDQLKDSNYLSYFRQSLELLIWFVVSLILFEFIEHKEIRFLQPLYPLLLIFLASGIYRLILESGNIIDGVLTEEFLVKVESLSLLSISTKSKEKLVRTYTTLITRRSDIRIWIMTFVLVIIIFQFSFASWNHSQEEDWYPFGDVHMAMSWAGEQDDLYGLCIIAHWYYTGGYTYLHNNITMLYIDDPGEETDYLLRYYVPSQINYLIIPKYKYSWYPNLRNDSIDLGFSFIKEVDGRCDVYKLTT